MSVSSQPASGAQSALGTKDLVLYTLTIFFFGTSWLPVRLHLAVVAPEVSGVWRFAVSAAVIFAAAALSGERLVYGRRDHLMFAALGLSLFSLNFLCFYYSGYFLASGLMSVVFALASVFIPLLAAVFLGVPIRPRIVGGAALGVAGIALVFGPQVMSTGVGNDAVIGAAFALGGTLCFAVGSLLSGVVARRGIPLLAMSAWSMAYGGAVFVLLAVAKGDHFMVEWSARYLLSLGWLIFGPTVSGYYAYLLLVRRIGASRAGYATVLYPLVALALSTAFEDFHWTIAAGLGIACVLAGNLVVLGRRS